MRHRRGWWTTFGIFLCLYMFIYFWGVGGVSKPSKLKKVMITSLLLCALSAQAEVVLHSAASIVWLSVNEINSIFFLIDCSLVQGTDGSEDENAGNTGVRIPFPKSAYLFISLSLPFLSFILMNTQHQTMIFK